MLSAHRQTGLSQQAPVTLEPMRAVEGAWPAAGGERWCAVSCTSAQPGSTDYEHRLYGLAGNGVPHVVDGGRCSRRVPLLLARPHCCHSCSASSICCVFCLFALHPQFACREVRSESCGDRWSERARRPISPSFLVPPVFGGSANRRSAHTV